MRPSPAILLLSISPILATATDAQVDVSLTSGRDNTLYELGGADVSNGAGQHLFTGVTGSGFRRRGLLWFDVAGAIPPGSTVTSASVRLRMSKTEAGALQVALRTVLADWGEAGSVAPGEQGGGAPAEPGDATWNARFFPGDRWTALGGDFSATTSAVTTVTGLGAYQWGSTAQLVADVQAWVDDPDSNFGWAILTQELGTVATKRFDTREHPTAANRPRLEITYTPPSASVGSVGAGCVGSSGLPFEIAATGLPTLGNAGFGAAATGGPATQLAFLFLASSTGTGEPVLSPTCPLYLDLFSTIAFVQAGVSPVSGVALDGAGAGSMPFPVPNNPNLLGFPLSVQSIALDPGVPEGLITSNALDLAFGV